MRVLFVTAVLPSHYFIMAPFAWALRAAGHEVYVAAQPELVETVARSGLPVVRVGREAEFANRYRSKADKGRHDPKVLFVDLADSMADDVVSFAAEWKPDVVVWEPTTLVGPLVAQVSGALSLRYLWGPDIVGRGIGRDNLPAEFADLLGRFGIALDDLKPWTNVDACPDAAQVEGTAQRMPVRYVPYSSAGKIPDWALRKSAKPRVCVTLGITMLEVNSSNKFFAPDVLDALVGMDIELVTAVISTQRHLLGNVPEGVVVAEDCALYEIMPHCDLVIHHGGVGSMLTAALNGTPQLTLTQMLDQGFYAKHLERTGASVHLTWGDTDAETLRATVGRMLEDPSYRQAAGEVRDGLLSRPTPADCVPIVERLVADAGRVPAGAAL